MRSSRNVGEGIVENGWRNSGYRSICIISQRLQWMELEKNCFICARVKIVPSRQWAQLSVSQGNKNKNSVFSPLDVYCQSRKIQSRLSYRKEDVTCFKLVKIKSKPPYFAVLSGFCKRLYLEWIQHRGEMQQMAARGLQRQQEASEESHPFH